MSQAENATSKFRSQLLEAQPWIAIAKVALGDLVTNGSGAETGRGQIMASDYSGDHSGASFQCYSYLMVDEHTHPWDAARRFERESSLHGGRRISYKNLRSGTHSLNFEWWLDSTRYLSGNLVVFAFSKALLRTLHPIAPDPIQFGLIAKWKRRELEEATRKALLGALLIDRLLPEKRSLTWYSDEDQSVSNGSAINDFMKMIMALTGMLSTTKRGYLNFGTTAQDCHHMFREDLTAIADISAGMIGDIVSKMKASTQVVGRSGMVQHVKPDSLKLREELIASWFWHADGGLRRTCYVFDYNANGRPSVSQLMLDLPTRS